MDNNLLVFIAFTLSTFIDILIIAAVFFLFYKIFKTRVITTENNGEIHVHDKMLVELQEEIDEIKHG